MLTLYGAEISSRLLLGTARYPSPAVLSEAVRQSATEIVTVSLRREMSGGRSGGTFFEMVRALGVRILPNSRLPQRRGSGADRKDGTRAVRHRLDQARGHRQP